MIESVFSTVSQPLSSSSQRIEGSVREAVAKPSVSIGSKSLDPEVPPGFEKSPPPKLAPSKAWASFFDKQKDPVPEVEIPLFHPQFEDGKRVITQVSTTTFEKEINRCENMVVGFFAGKRLSYHLVRNFVSRAWKLKVISILQSRVIICLFLSLIMMRIVELLWNMVLYLFHNNSSLLDLGTRILNKMLLNCAQFLSGVNLRQVPLYMWNVVGLGMISSNIGVPIMMDKQTLNRTRMSYARMCVEITADCEFSSSIPLIIDGKDTVEVKVEYTWKPY